MSTNVVLVGSSSSLGEHVKAQLEGARCAIYRVDRCDGFDLCDPLCAGRAAVATSAALAAQAERAGLEPRRAGVQIDALIFLAGDCPGWSLPSYADERIDETMEVNLTGPIRFVREFLPLLRRPSGQVILLSSIAIRGGFDPVYAAAKAGLSGFVRSMAEHTPGVRFNALAPGLIEDSGMCRRMTPDRQAAHARETPTGRLLSLQEVGSALVDLVLSPAWASLNGQVIHLDGGRR